MSGKRKSHRIKVILSLSNINADFLQLILCMFVSHYIIDNPLFGASLFLFTNIWILYFQGNLRKILKPFDSGTTLFMWLLLTLSVLAGLVIMFFYPIMVKSPQANLVSFFVLMVAARSILTSRVNQAFSKPKRSHRIYKVLFQLMFLAAGIVYCVCLMEGLSMWIVIAGLGVTGVLASFQGSTLVSLGKYVNRLTRDKLADIASYRVYSNMTLYSQIAFSLAVLMFVCYMSFGSPSFSINSYLLMTVWLVFVLFSSELFTWIVNRQGRVLSANLFIVGAAMWTVGSVMMYRAEGFWTTSLWTNFWGFGLACITSVLNRYNLDFKMVARIADRRVSDRDLYFRSMITQIIAVIFSNVVMLCVLTVWTFGVPTFTNAELPGAFRRVMVQLPVVFMIIGVVFALKQPLDKRRRQKLMNYASGTSQNTETKKSLNETLVQEKKVRFGVKIIAFFVRPFLRLKVSGKEHILQENFPSVFVCNHGIIYGPIAAVIYLPTYFRPWIDRKMVDRDVAAREMYDRHIYRIPLLSKKAKTWIARQLARPVTWALNSFDPIPVDKSSMRGIMNTFDDTVQVLSEGDNVLIFPEKPRRVKRGKKMTVEHETRTVGSLYTGFANIGTLYHEKTGKDLCFYPIYANKKNHTFRIGEAVTFDHTNNPRDEKQRIAETLQQRMLTLKETK